VTAGKERQVPTGPLIEGKGTAAITRVQAYVRVSPRPTPSSLALHWRLERAALAEAAQLDSLYALVTNLLPTQAPAREIFRLYKEQSQVERRFRAVKQPPIQVRPLWLHHPQRIESLVFAVIAAIFLFALIEREARREVQQSGQVFTGLRPEGRDHLPVKAAQLVAAFAALSLVKQRLRIGTDVFDVLTPTTLTPIQAQILKRLHLIPPNVYLHSRIDSHPT
jgi:hypothetical protein